MMISDIEKMKDELEDMQRRHEEVLSKSRFVIRRCAEAITALHNADYAKAKIRIDEARKAVAGLRKIEKGFENSSLQAHQEYVEAITFYNIVVNGSAKLPSRESLGEATGPYILGLMDLIGELKRSAVDALRHGKQDDAKAYYAAMKGIYDDTLPISFASQILPDFRKKQDVARIQIESIENSLLLLKI
ncbi:MAG: hypothetical protein QXZ38_02835 [Candidatus Micrarchaeaceae archaeon]